MEIILITGLFCCINIFIEITLVIWLPFFFHIFMEIICLVKIKKITRLLAVLCNKTLSSKNDFWKRKKNEKSTR